MNEELNVQNTEQNNSADQSERTGADQNNREEVKTFTQEEVDKIVEKRLSRERKKFANVLEGVDPREAALAERERELNVKELKAEAKPLLMEKGIPLEALDLLDYTDKESCDRSMKVLTKIMSQAGQERVDQLIKGGKPPRKAPESAPDAALRQAFGL